MQKMSHAPTAWVRFLHRGDFSRTLDTQHRMPKEQATYLCQNQNMTGHPLSVVLESARWGGTYGVMWEMNVREMTSFIETWMRQNPNHYSSLFLEPEVRELYPEMRLPRISNTDCPRYSHHQKRVEDNRGRIRCAAVEKLIATEEVVSIRTDNFALLPRIRYELGKDHERKVEISDPCYAVIAEPERVVLPLERILYRVGEEKTPSLAVGRGVDTHNFHCNFDGHALAAYVQKWAEQSSNPPLFELDR